MRKSQIEKGWSRASRELSKMAHRDSHVFVLELEGKDPLYVMLKLRELLRLYRRERAESRPLRRSR